MPLNNINSGSKVIGVTGKGMIEAFRGRLKTTRKLRGDEKEGLMVYQKCKEALLPDLSYFVEEGKEERKDIHLPLDILSPRQREVVCLLYYDCLSETEAGRKLGISRSTIRTHKKRALKKLKRA